MSLKSTADLIAQAQQHISCLDAATARRRYDDATTALIIDVREAESAAKGKLKDSLNVSRGMLELKMHKVCDNPDTLIFTHCAGGGRASLAAHTLQNMGYRNVHAITAKYEDIKALFG